MSWCGHTPFWLCAAHAVSFLSTPACQCHSWGLCMCCDLWMQELISMESGQSSTTQGVSAAAVCLSSSSSPHPATSYPALNLVAGEKSRQAAWHSQLQRCKKGGTECHCCLSPFLLMLNAGLRGGREWVNGGSTDFQDSVKAGTPARLLPDQPELWLQWHPDDPGSTHTGVSHHIT